MKPLVKYTDMYLVNSFEVFIFSIVLSTSRFFRYKNRSRGVDCCEMIINALTTSRSDDFFNL